MRAILTFYSYKGGVGRTMALANIAILLARKGLRVLIVDWDLEAPGLHRYFVGLKTVSHNLGLLDLLLDAVELRQAPDWRKYASTVTIENSTVLTMLSAGKFDDAYEKRVLDFDWQHFFRDHNGGEILEALRQQWTTEFDVTLIDSRTGITDAGGICTVQMPDILVPVFSPNHQSLEGTKHVVQKAQSARQTLAYDRTRLLVFPLLSRFDSRTEYRESQHWLRLCESELKDFYVDWLPKDITPLQMIERTKIPYVAFFSFGEKLPVVTEGTTDPESLGFAYENAATLIANDFKGADQLVSAPSIGPVTDDKSLAPRREWLFSPTKRFAQFIEEIIASKDVHRFKMLIEMARGSLIETWQLHNISGPGLPTEITKWNSEITEFYQHEFLPALDSVVDIALQVIKYDAPITWVALVIDVLIECFDKSRGFDRLKSAVIATAPNALHYARPAYDTYVGCRAVAIYAAARKRFQFLATILPRFVRVFTVDGYESTLVPLLFWPFRGVIGLPDMTQGRNQSFWDDHIGKAWGHHFGNIETFLNAAGQLEFILEFNSYIFEGVQDPQVKRLQQTLGNKLFTYLPDFWTSRLDSTLPIAEHFYDILRLQPTLPIDFAIEKQAIDLVFSNKDSAARLLFLGGYLLHLKIWQGQVMMQQNRFPFMFEWPGRLKQIVDAFRERTKKKAT